MLRDNAHMTAFLCVKPRSQMTSCSMAEPYSTIWIPPVRVGSSSLFTDWKQTQKIVLVFQGDGETMQM